MSDTTPGATGATAAPDPFSFQPFAGGDVVLKSCDDTIFRAHSALLGMASTVFADMFAGATKPDTIELAEDAESVSLMLASIYPVAPPTIDTLDLLEKFMIIGQKYNVERMLKFVEQNIQSKINLILLDPVRVFRTSIEHNLPAVQALAAKSLRPSRCDLLAIEGLLSLAKTFPNSAHIIGLVGAQGVRVKILSEFILREPLSHGMQPECQSSHWNNSNWGHSHYAICSACWKTNLSIYANRYYYKPGWFTAWSDRLYRALLELPMDQCEQFFSVTRLAELKGVSGACANCVTKALDKNDVFDQWAQGVKQILEKELNALDVLYSL